MAGCENKPCTKKLIFVREENFANAIVSISGHYEDTNLNDERLPDTKVEYDSYEDLPIFYKKWLRGVLTRKWGLLLSDSCEHGCHCHLRTTARHEDENDIEEFRLTSNDRMITETKEILVYNDDEAQAIEKFKQNGCTDQDGNKIEYAENMYEFGFKRSTPSQRGNRLLISFRHRLVYDLKVKGSLRTVHGTCKKDFAFYNNRRDEEYYAVFNFDEDFFGTSRKG